MGHMLIEAALADPAIELAVALDRPDSPALGRDCGEFLGRATRIRVESDLGSLARAQVLIDFTRPEATLRHLEACAQSGVNIVIGTTGFDAAGKDAIRAAADRIAIVFSPNMSVGVNATFKLVELAARILGDGYDAEIVEAHHRHKVDAPSGTALKMGEVIAAARAADFDTVAVRSRNGITGERKTGAIGFAAIRGGDIVGDHTVLFAGPGERVEITHRSSNRSGYAAGSLRAAHFVAARSAGLFDMSDVLGL
jgi:4-hydroxy-tetrahydrodipicolinate reductase